MQEVIEAFIRDQSNWGTCLSKLNKPNEQVTIPCNGYVFPKNLDIPKSLCQRLFVRDCYINFYAKLNDDESETMSSVLTGRPGIGKSMFGLYAVVRKILEVLTQSNQRKEFKLIYVVGYTMIKIRIPTVIPSIVDASGLVESLNIGRLETWLAHINLQHCSHFWTIIDPVNADVARYAANSLAEVGGNAVLYLCIASPGLLKAPGDTKSATGRFGHCNKPTLKPWNKEEMKALLDMYAKTYVSELASRMNFVKDMKDVLGSPETPDPYGFFSDLKCDRFKENVKEDAKNLYNLLINAGGTKMRKRLLEDLLKQSEWYEKATAIVLSVLNYRCEVVGYSVRSILQGNVRKALFEYYESSESKQLPKAYFDCCREENGYLDLQATNYGKLKPGSTVVYKMEAVKHALTAVKKALKRVRNHLPAIHWCEHERVCYYTLASVPEKYQFEFTKCDDERKVKSLVITEKFEHKEVGALVTKYPRHLDYNTYYKCCSNQPVIDAFVYTKSSMRDLSPTTNEKILLIQATVSKRHDAKPEPFNRIVSHLVSLLKQETETIEDFKKRVKWYFIFFIATQNFKRTKFPSKLTAEISDTTLLASSKSKKRKSDDPSKTTPGSQTQDQHQDDPKEKKSTWEIKMDTYQVRFTGYREFLENNRSQSD